MPDKDEELLQKVAQEAKDLIKMLETTSVRRLRLVAATFRIEIERVSPRGRAAGGGAAVGRQPAPLAPPEKDTLHRVLAPLLGTFYHAASPGAKPFVEVGKRVERGQPIGIVEAMKIMNEVQSDAAGVVVEILVANGQAVQYEQPLLVLDTSS